MLVLEKLVRMTLKQEKEKECDCAGGLNAESVLLAVRLVKSFALLLEVKGCSWCSPCHAHFGAGMVQRKVNVFL